MRKLPGTNRLYENEHPEVYDKINWYKNKSEWLEDFNKCLFIKNITPDRILKTLNLNKTEYKEYSEYLFNSILLLQDKRRKRSIEVRKSQKEDKKTELKRLIKMKNTTHKNWSWKYVSDLMNITVRHLRRLRNEIEVEDKNKSFLNNINILKGRLDDYINTKKMIKEFGYNNVSKKKFGNIKHIDKLLKNYDIINVNQFLHILNCNITFILQKSSYYKSGKLEKNIEMFQYDFDCFGKDGNGNVIDGYFGTYRVLNELKEEKKILRLIDEYNYC